MAEQTFSARVSLSIIVEGQEIQLSQVGPEFFSLKEDCEPIEPQEAELVIQIEDRIDRKTILLENRLDSCDKRVRYTRVATPAVS